MHGGLEQDSPSRNKMGGGVTRVVVTVVPTIHPPTTTHTHNHHESTQACLAKIDAKKGPLKTIFGGLGLSELV